MKKRELDSLCRSTCDYLCSRNNDISGYWGIGVLCRLSFLKARRRLGFRTAPGLPIHIFGCELSNSSAYTSMLGTLGVDSIEGRLSFFDDGRFVNGRDKYTCGVSIAMTSGTRLGLFVTHVSCWQHDPTLERRRAGSLDSVTPN